MADEPRDDEARESFPSDPFADDVLRTFPPEPSNGVEWEWDPVQGFTHPTGVLEGADEGRGLPDEDPNAHLNLGELKPDEAPTDPTGVFVHRETGRMIRIINSDESFVRYAALDGSSRNAMPRADYTRLFHKSWRPADGDDLQKAFAEKS